MANKKQALREVQTYQLNRFAEQGNLPALKKLLAAGADRNAADPDSGFRPLISAAAKGRLDIVKFLLAQGVSPDVRVRPAHDYPIDYQEGTALMLAALGIIGKSSNGC